MKKAILRILLLIFGLNVFTACYGMPPADWPEPPTEEQDNAKALIQDSENLDELDELDELDGLDGQSASNELNQQN